MPEDSPALLEALRMMDAMRQENRDLAGQVGYLQARVQIHEETIRALTAPAENSVAGQQTVSAVEPTTDAPEGSRSPWWRTPDGWITPGVALVVLAVIVVQLLLVWLAP